MQNSVSLEHHAKCKSCKKKWNGNCVCSIHGYSPYKDQIFTHFLEIGWLYKIEIWQSIFYIKMYNVWYIFLKSVKVILSKPSMYTEVEDQNYTLLSSQMFEHTRPSLGRSIKNKSRKCPVLHTQI